MKTVFVALLSASIAMCPLAARAQPSFATGDDLEQGLWWLYHLRYEKAIGFYDRYIAAHPDDPAGYFYKAAADWWRLAQEFEYSQSDIQKRFDQSVNLTIQKAQAQIKALDEDKPENAKTLALTHLYWGGAEGLRGRWLVTQKHWVKAYFAGRNGYNLLKKAVKLDPTLYDAYLGLGIYDYFSDTLSGVAGALSAILVRGDRKRGIATLEDAVLKGNHARVEAMIFLVEIYTFEEKQPDKAIPHLQKLRTDYPNSPLMHLAELMTLYQQKHWDDVTREATIYEEKSLAETPEYQKSGAGPARYCLGISEFWGRNNLPGALKHFEHIISSTTPDDPNRWVSFALLRRGQIYDLMGEREKALSDYSAVLARPAMWGTHQEARQHTKKPYAYSQKG